MMSRRSSRCSLLSCIATIVATITTNSNVVTSLLLSDLPTPSFIIDVQALRRVVGPPINDFDIPSSQLPRWPSIRLPKNGILLHPFGLTKNENEVPITALSDGEDNTDKMVLDVNFPVVEGQPAIGYIHSSITRGRDDFIAGGRKHNDDDPTISTFLAEIDLDPSLCGASDGAGATLVLGLNNHHVGSYYWARSAGAGASMEAPGVCFDGGILRWTDDGGPTVCNSNDGKRSEWVNFLRKGDTVQLVPEDGQDAILQFRNRYSGSNNNGQQKEQQPQSIHVFGISAEGRPMGSEPAVVCEWR